MALFKLVPIIGHTRVAWLGMVPICRPFRLSRPTAIFGPGNGIAGRPIRSDVDDRRYKIQLHYFLVLVSVSPPKGGGDLTLT